MPEAVSIEKQTEGIGESMRAQRDGSEPRNRELMLGRAEASRGRRACGRTVAVMLALVCLLSGCAASGENSAASLAPAFSGEAYGRTVQAMAEKDEGAIPVSVVMTSYATPGKTAPFWSYLFASQRYAKFYTVFNYSTKATASIYGATTWTLEDWKAAPQDVPSTVAVDADDAYRSVLEKHPEYSSHPFRVSFLAYEPEIEKTEDAPDPMTWYFYFTTEEALEVFDSSVENPNDIANAIVTVDAQTGEVSQLQ